MGFWNTSDGENVTENAEKEYDIGGGDLDPIPNNSSVLAMIESIGWVQDASFNNYINVKWSVEKPESYANRKIWQKLWVKDADPRTKDAAKADAKRDKALRMLATIDANCGGRLAKRGTEPDDDDLMLALAQKPLVIKVMTWEMEGKIGNWIAAVGPKTKALEIGKSAPPKTSGKSAKEDLDSDIPF